MIAYGQSPVRCNEQSSIVVLYFVLRWLQAVSGGSVLYLSSKNCVSFLIFIMIVSSTLSLAAAPDKANTFPGWSELWTRTGQSGTALLKPGVAGSPATLVVTHQAPSDWSLPSSSPTNVTPGQILTLSVVGKSNGNAQVSCILRDPKGAVIAWEWAGLPLPKSADLVPVHRVCVVPDGAASIQLRLTGRGSGVSECLQPVLAFEPTPARTGSLPEALSVIHGDVQLTIDPQADRLLIQKKGQRRCQWSLFGDTGSWFLVSLEPEENAGIRARFLDDQARVVSLLVKVTKDQTVQVSVESTEAMDKASVLPGPLLAEKGDDWVIPLNEGLRVPVTDPYFKVSSLRLYSGHGLCMPFIGLVHPDDSGWLLRCNTPDDATALFKKPVLAAAPGTSDVKPSSFAFEWQAQKNRWAYTRQLELTFVPRGGHTGIAKAYRDYIASKGLLVSLAQKAKSRPALKNLAGAVDLWYFADAPHWTRDPQPETFGAKLKALGVDRVLWSNGGSSGSLQALNALGFVTGRYDIFQDLYDPQKAPKSYIPDRSAGWPQDLVWDETLQARPGWVVHQASGDLVGGIANSATSLAHMKERIPADLAINPYQARFLDTTTAAPLYEDWNPLHPQTRSEDKSAKIKLLSYLSSTLGLVTGSETGIDWAAPHLDYFEGMMSLAPFRLPDSGYDPTSRKIPQEDFVRFQVGGFYRIPLFGLVYHDAVMATWYWGDACNRVPEYWNERDILDALYGTMPLWIIDPATWSEHQARFLQSYRTVSPVLRAVAFTSLDEHGYLTKDRLVQFSRFGNGTIVRANFGAKPYTLKDGHTIPARSFRVDTGTNGLTD